MEENGDTPIDMSKLTKGQKKALKEKLKKEAAAKAGVQSDAPPKEESKGPPPPEASKSSGPKAKGKKGKKGAASGVGAAIKKKLAEQKEYQEALAREEEELKQKALEEQRQREEEERKKHEEERKKEMERIAHLRELKKKGLLLSKKEQAKKEQMEEARRQLIEQGLVDADHFEKQEENPKQKIVYSSKKKKSKNKSKQDDAKPKEEVKQENNENESVKVDDEKEKAKIDVDNPKENKKQFNVEAGYEEQVEKPKPGTQESSHEIDDNLKVDNWEDFLDENVANEQVKLHNEANPTEQFVEEDSLNTTAKTETNQIKQQKNEDIEEEKKVAPKSKTSKKNQKTSDSASTPSGSIFELAGAAKKSRGGKKKKKIVEEEVIEEDDGTKFRCPIICVLGHVDTGKTLLLDKIRKTNVQRGEAGGITQQIGATYFPGEALQNNIDKLGDDFDVKEVKIPGLLVIDTPGHESFTNLRSRGSNLCDLAVLVVDVMHGLEKQTLESIELLRKRKTPFIVALNKIDRMHSFKSEEYRSSKISLEKQHQTVIDEYEKRRDQAFLQFNEIGLNIVEYWNNSDPRTYISAVPTSAMTGEGIPDILGMIVKCTQKMLKKQITQKNTEFQ